METTNILLGQSSIGGQTTGVSFIDVQNVLQNDGTVAKSNGTSDITVGNFNFNLSQNAVVTGVEFFVKARRGIQTNPNTALQFSAVNGTQTLPFSQPFTGLTTEFETYQFGGQNYQFATQFTVDELNNLALNIQANEQVYIDVVYMKAYYFETTSGEPVEYLPKSCEDCDGALQTLPHFLAVPLTPTATKILLRSFDYADGTPVTMEDLGECGGSIDLVVDEGLEKGNGNRFMENIRIPEDGSITRLANGTVEIDIVSIENRGLKFSPPYDHDPELLSNHDANAKVIVSNNAPFYGKFLRKCHIGTLVSAPIVVQSDDNEVTNPTTTFNFKGQVIVDIDPNDPEKANITIPGSGTIAPTVNSTHTATSGNTEVTELEVSDVSVLGTNRGLLVMVSSSEPVNIVYTDQDNLTEVITEGTSSIYYLADPVVGETNITVELSSAGYVSVIAMALSGVGGVGASEGNTGTSFDPAVLLTTTQNNSLVFDALSTFQLPILHTQGVNQVKNASIYETASLSSSYQPAGLAPDFVNMTWEITQDTDWDIASAELLGITSSEDDKFVGARSSDTTPSYLDDKIEMVAASGNITVNKTIQNSGGNEKIRYTFDVQGGGGNEGFNLLTSQSGATTNYEALTGDVDGTNTTFTVFGDTYIENAVWVYLNGQLLEDSQFTQTDPATGTIDLTVAPQTDDVVTVKYLTVEGNIGAQSGIQFQNNGSNLGSQGTVKTLNFSSNLNAQRTGDTVTVTGTGGSGGGSNIGNLSFTKNNGVYIDNYFASGSSNITGSALRRFQPRYTETTDNNIVTFFRDQPNTSFFNTRELMITSSSDLYGNVVRDFETTLPTFGFYPGFIGSTISQSRATFGTFKEYDNILYKVYAYTNGSTTNRLVNIGVAYVNPINGDFGAEVVHATSIGDLVQVGFPNSFSAPNVGTVKESFIYNGVIHLGYTSFTDDETYFLKIPINSPGDYDTVTIETTNPPAELFLNDGGSLVGNKVFSFDENLIREHEWDGTDLTLIDNYQIPPAFQYSFYPASAIFVNKIIDEDSDKIDVIIGVRELVRTSNSATGTIKLIPITIPK